jgi:hypothetical protein
MWSRAIGIACLAAVLWAVPAAAQEPANPFVPWDGSNPFNCTIQDVGTGTDFPDPDADPFCVEFDKTQQNVTDLGIVEFLVNEPARTAAAGPKCFYYQTDHWTGSIVQGEQPELWHWDGQYYFDKAKGAGGVNLQNFRIGGQPASFPPGSLPEEFQPYMDQGGGGAYLTESFPVDPSCAAKVDTPEEARQVYAQSQGPTAQPPPDIENTPLAPIAQPVKSKRCKHRKGGHSASKRCKKRNR